MTREGFADHFSEVSDDYARHRPTYPPALFEYLAGIVGAPSVAWDCGTGNGQAAQGLAAVFRRVIGSDASLVQLRRAARGSGRSYVACRAEALPAADRSVDLVTVAQALHWFHLDRFFSEVRRVLRPGGAFAAWTYRLCHVNERLDPLLLRFHMETVGPYWAAERRQVEDGYRGIRLPFREVEAPPLEMTARWSLEDLLGYLGTWSAVRAYRKATGEDPVARARDGLSRGWGETAVQTVRWPLTLRVGIREER